MSYFVTNYHQQQKSLFHSNSDWVVAMLRLESISEHATITETTDDCVTFLTDPQAPKPNKLYKLQIYKDMLRLSSDKEGHMPLLLNQNYLRLQVQDQVLRITSIDQFGRKWEYYVDFQSASSKASSDDLR
ncbi:ComGF family competence protein [Bombilactobacillus folatiphilus]|uniref:ComGF family competence protein n=1 Tax=Bombilactobacillus folatiphilus TaxID=2923362 RepID=A0ABY4P9T0_9LACO|nr:ComGF family competence protein [Bombilactobacillus folatiphilus]UQS82498.1 ComGF family competence protein [Bombilactobacillus folatiphilus]